MNISINLPQSEERSLNLEKIAKLVEILPSNIRSITGVITPYEVALMIDSNRFTIAGVWDEAKETMLSHVWEGNMPIAMINWHPLNTMGGFDMEQFVKELNTITQC